MLFRKFISAALCVCIGTASVPVGVTATPAGFTSTSWSTSLQDLSDTPRDPYTRSALSVPALWTRLTEALPAMHSAVYQYERLTARLRRLRLYEIPPSGDLFLDKIYLNIEDAANAIRRRRPFSRAQLDSILKPSRVTELRISWSAGSKASGRALTHGGLFEGDTIPKTAAAWRVVHREPGQGGNRFDIDLTRNIATGLAAEMDIKDVLMGLPLGGGKGGVQVNVEGRSPAEVARIMRAFVTAVLDDVWEKEHKIAFSIAIDGGAPDMYTGRAGAVYLSEIANDARLRWLDEKGIQEVDGIAIPATAQGFSAEALGDGSQTPYVTAVVQEHHRRVNAGIPSSLLTLVSAFTGSRPENGGINGRDEATGRGLAYATVEMLRAVGDPRLGLEDDPHPLHGLTAAVQGFGNVGGFLVQSYVLLGARVQAITELGTDRQPFALYRKDGFTEEILAALETMGRGVWRDPQQRAEPLSLLGIEVISMGQFWKLPVDVLAPCVQQNEITDGIAQSIQARYIIEGANGPTLYTAKKILEARGKYILPDVFANAGGVAVSYLNKVQNKKGSNRTGSDVHGQLRAQVQRNFRKLNATRIRYGVSFVTAAYILWLERRSSIQPEHVSLLQPERDIREWQDVQGMFETFKRTYAVDFAAGKNTLRNPYYTGTPTARVLMSYPQHFTVPWSINPHMKPGKQRVNRVKAALEWERLVDTYLRLGVEVVLIEQDPELADQVFTANGAVVDGTTAIPAIFTKEVRRAETPLFTEYFRTHGYQTPDVLQGRYQEGEGDSLVHDDDHFGVTRFGGYGSPQKGLRSDLGAQKAIASTLRQRFVGLELINPDFYHLDTCFFPLGDGKTALYYPEAFTPEAQNWIRQFVSNPVAIGKKDAYAFAANGMVINRTVILNKASWRLKRTLSNLGFSVVEVPMTEFLKSGGSVKCLTLLLSGWLRFKEAGDPAKAAFEAVRQLRQSLGIFRLFTFISRLLPGFGSHPRPRPTSLSAA